MRAAFPDTHPVDTALANVHSNRAACRDKRDSRCGRSGSTAAREALIKSIAGYKIEKATIGERAGDQLPLHSDAFETSACLPPTVGQPLRRR